MASCGPGTSNFAATPVTLLCDGGHIFLPGSVVKVLSIDIRDVISSLVCHACDIILTHPFDVALVERTYLWGAALGPPFFRQRLQRAPAISIFYFPRRIKVLSYVA